MRSPIYIATQPAEFQVVGASNMAVFATPPLISVFSLVTITYTEHKKANSIDIHRVPKVTNKKGWRN